MKEMLIDKNILAIHNSVVNPYVSRKYYCSLFRVELSRIMGDKVQIERCEQCKRLFTGKNK